MLLGTAAPIFAGGATPVATPPVSYNSGAASVYHAPVSSIGLVALSKDFPSAKGTPSTLSPSATSAIPQGVPAGMTWFINDSSYAPQSETSVAVNPANTQQVVGGYNDGRYFFCPVLLAQDCPDGYTESVTGFTTSADGGATVAKSNDLPGLQVTEANLTSGRDVTGFLASWGDPSVAAAPDGTFYFASLAIDPNSGASGVMIQKSNSNLWNPAVDCSTPLNTSYTNPCWTAHLVYGNLSFQCGLGGCGQASFEDKDTIAVDNSASSPYYGYVYVAWDHFFANGESSTYLALCSPTLSCTMLSGGSKPVVSGSDKFVAFSTPAVDSSGHVYVTWCNFGTPTTYGPVYCSVASSPPGGASFGPAHTVLSFMGAGTQLAGDTVVNGFATEQFRTASEPTFAAGGGGDLYFAIPLCVSGFYYRFTNDPALASDNPGNCGTSAIFFASSSDGGATWSSPAQVSAQGVEIQPTLSVDQSTGAVVLAYYTSQFDPFEHRLDVGVDISHDGGSTFSFVRATSVSNEPNSDPSLYDYITSNGFGGSFVVPQYGDYFTAEALNGKVWVLFTGNYAQVQGTYKDSPFLTMIGEVPTSLNLTSNAKDAAPGDTVGFVAGGFTPTSTLSLTLRWEGETVSLANVTVSQAGTAQGNFTVPNLQSQVYSVVAGDGTGLATSATLGVGQVSLGGIQGALSTIQGSLASLDGLVGNGFSTLGSTVTGTGATLGASIQSLQAKVGPAVTGSGSTLSVLVYLILAALILLVVGLVLQVRGRKPAEQTSQPSPPAPSPSPATAPPA